MKHNQDFANQIEKLEAELAIAPDGPPRIDALNNLAWELFFRDAQRASALCEEALSIASSDEYLHNPYQQGMATSLAHLGRIKIEMGDYTNSVILLLKALPIFELMEHKTGAMQVHNSLGILYTYVSDYAQALNHYYESSRLAELLDNKLFLNRIYFNIGYCYLKAQKVDRALEFFELCRRADPSFTNDTHQAFLLDGMANVYLQLGKLEEALAFAQQGLALSQQIRTMVNEVDCWCTLSDIYQARGEHRQALACLQSGLETARSNLYIAGEVEALRRIGEIHHRQQQDHEAIDFLAQALSRAQEVGLKKTQYECHLSLSQAYKQARQYEQALNHHEQFFVIKENVFNETSEMKLKTLDVLYQLTASKKETEIHRRLNFELQREIEERKRAQADLEKMATTDFLTGLHNRRQFIALAELQLQQAARYKSAISFILFDIDNFKKVNDTYGHQIGDQVLVWLAKLTSNTLRKVDLIGRFGGEEFVILLPQNDQTAACVAAERLRKQVAAESISTDAGPVQITISLGGVAPSDTEMSLDQIIALADQALYWAKQHGRNQVALAKEDYTYQSVVQNY